MERAGAPLENEEQDAVRMIMRLEEQEGRGRQRVRPMPMCNLLHKAGVDEDDDVTIREDGSGSIRVDGSCYYFGTILGPWDHFGPLNRGNGL